MRTKSHIAAFIEGDTGAAANGPDRAVEVIELSLVEVDKVGGGYVDWMIDGEWTRIYLGR